MKKETVEKLKEIMRKGKRRAEDITDVWKLANEVKEQIRNYIPKEYGELDIQVRSAWKNNVEKVGITIRNIAPDSWRGETIAPAFWMNEMRGTPEEICQGIAQAYIRQKEKEFFDIISRNSMITDYSRVKPQLRCRVVGIRNNEEMLKGIIHKKVLNLAVVPYILSEHIDGENLTGVINMTRDLAEAWQVSDEQVMKDALKNMDRKEAMFTSMPDLSLCTLTNSSRNIPYVTSGRIPYGAFWMLDREKLREIGNALGDFTILPKSVHRVMIIPDAEILRMGGFEQAEKMNREMNGREAPPQIPSEERLSDTVYYKDGKIKMEMEILRNFVGEISAQVPVEERLPDTIYHYDAKRQILSVPLHEMEIPAKELPMTGRKTMKKERRGR